MNLYLRMSDRSQAENCIPIGVYKKIVYPPGIPVCRTPTGVDRKNV